MREYRPAIEQSFARLKSELEWMSSLAAGQVGKAWLAQQASLRSLGAKPDKRALAIRALAASKHT